MSLNKKRAFFLLAMILAGSICTLLYLAITGNTPQKYTDVIIEYTSTRSCNKSAERTLVYLLVFGGIASYTLFFICTRKKQAECMVQQEAGLEKQGDASKFLCLLCMLAIVYYFIFAQINPVLLASLAVALMIYMVDKELALHGLVVFYMGVYALGGLYRVYVFAGGTRNANSMLFALFMTAVLLFLLMCKNRKQILLRCCLAEQLFVPAVLLIYVSSKYSYQGRIVTIPVPGAVKVLTAVLTAAFFAEAAFRLVRNWNMADGIGRVVGFGSCVCIMAFNRFDCAGAVLSADMHHPYENIIGYQQIFELGQKPFSEYIPVSGMYSVVQGAVFQLFGHGEMGNYYVAQNVFFLLVLLLAALLLRRQVSGECMFLVALVYSLRSYNRDAFLLPVMLLLILPGLMERKNLWLQAWFLSSLFQGLYYPVFGAACCIAFLPLGICQAVGYVKSGQLTLDVKKARFWAGWAACLLAAAVCIPCLAGTYRHILAMAGQTVYADGIARFGQAVPDWFFPYLYDCQILRIALYLAATFMVPVIFVWVAYALALKIGAEKKDRQGAAVAVSVAVMLAVSFSHTFTRLDFSDICSRSIGGLLAVMVVLLVVLERYLCRERFGLFMVSLVVLAPAVSARIGFFALDAKLQACVAVPEEYVFVDQTDIERLGACFMPEAVYDTVESVYAAYAGEAEGRAYLGAPGDFGYFYLCGAKGSGVMETYATLKGYEAVQESAAVAKEQKAAVGNVSPLYSYYLYHWLMASGEYAWSGEKGYFLPNDGAWTKEQVRERHKGLLLAQEGLDIGKSAGSFGMSMDSLQGIFTRPDVEVSPQQEGDSLLVRFSKGIDGDEADFLYLEFAGMEQDFQYTLYDGTRELEQACGPLAKYLMKKNYNPGVKVRVGWQDETGQEHTMDCDMERGKLLLPLGSGVNWLLHEHTQLRISAIKDGQEIMPPQAVDIRLLKLREIA